jgi:hypothetical protein
MSLLARAKNRRPSLPLRGEIATAVATPPALPKRSLPPAKQNIVITADGPVARRFPGFLDAENRPLWGSPEAAAELESARAKWRQEHGEPVDEG